MAAFSCLRPRRRDARRRSPRPQASRARPPPRTDWEDLAAQLEELLAGAWVAVKDGGAINETRAFAERLTELGPRPRGRRRLARYGEALAREAQTYAVAGSAARLNTFPMLVLSITEESTAPTS